MAWAKALGGVVSVSGTDGSNDGWLTVIASVIAGIGAWSCRRSGARSRALMMSLAGVGVTAVALYDWHH